MAFYHYVTGRGRYRLWPSPLDILWHVPAEEYRGAVGGLPHAKFLGRVNAFVYRESWEDPDAFYIAMQAGSNEEGHAHLDVGTFVMDAYGERWALDLGSERQTYLVHQYPKKSRPSRWDFYRLRAEGHNTLVLNPGRGPDQNPKGAGRKIRFESTPDGLIGIADLTGVYGKEASRVWRGIRVADRRKAVIQDEVTLKQPGELWWFLHTEHGVKTSKDGQSATLVSKSGKAACDVHLLSPSGARLQVMDARPLPTTADPSKQNQNENIYKLAIHLEDVKKATIAVSLIPRKQNAASVNPYDKVIEPLDEW
jgi:hypothetical protein